MLLLLGRLMLAFGTNCEKNDWIGRTFCMKAQIARRLLSFMTYEDIAVLLISF